MEIIIEWVILVLALAGMLSIGGVLGYMVMYILKNWEDEVK